MGIFGKSERTNDGRPGFVTTSGANILVTGSSGLVGARLVEMLLERGASLVRAFDIVPPSEKLKKRFDTACEGQKGKYECIVGNLTDKQACLDACKGIDVIYHIAALVGPFHDRSMYMAVNYDGTLNMLEGAIQETKSAANRTVRFIYSSSPSTRFTGADVTGQREEELPIPDKFLALYAESKAYAEKKVSDAYKLHQGLLTISVAPHQVYGPYDALFLPSLLETAGHNNLRIFGSGKNLISVCYVDNYCHGLMCGADALEEGSNALGKFYIVTDGPEQNFWGILNTAIVAMGFSDLLQKFHLPVWLLMGLAHICDVIGWMLNKKLKLNPFNVKMLVIHRYFSIENAQHDLKYEPLFTFDEAWGSTIDWFKIHWLPGFLEGKNGSSKTK